MFAPLLSSLAVLLLLLTALPSRGLRAAVAFEPMAGLRVRQENLRNVYWFDANEDDRDWIRFRGRVGLGAQLSAAHRLELRLVNENRLILEPREGEHNWDEIVLDRLLWRYRPEGKGLTLTLGRQDVVWNDGFLVLEGHPYDGSRSMYQNAARAELGIGERTLEMLAIHNPKRDPLVLVNDQDRALQPADETALALRLYCPAGRQLALLVKGEDDPDHRVADLRTVTLALRLEGRWGESDLMGELAVQHVHQVGSRDGVGLAGQLRAGYALDGSTRGELGAFHYSGDDGDWKGFRAPWGGWPRWSEMFIYSLIGEDGVAAWRNLSAPWVRASRRLREGATLRGTTYWLTAPEPVWRSRGSLTELKLSLDLGHGLSGHLLWEWLHPTRYPAPQEDAHFLRWEVSCELP